MSALARSICCALVVLSGPASVQPPDPVDRILASSVGYLGGEAAIRAVSSRVVRGRFDNGRGLVARFEIRAKAPDKLVTSIGPAKVDEPNGSGRGFDGAEGWDKNYIGTGVRVLGGAELADLKRDADIHRPLHFRTNCTRLIVEKQAEVAGVMTNVVRCDLPEGRSEWHYFADTGRRLRFDTQLWQGGGIVSTYYEDYRVVDGVRLPFAWRSAMPGATVVTFTVDEVRHNEPIADAVFHRPAMGREAR